MSEVKILGCSAGPRSLRSFGVAGLLSENAEIYTIQLFNHLHIGRIADLAAAKIRSLKLGGATEHKTLNELKLRELILYSAFEAYETQKALLESGLEGLSLAEPVGLEIGVDEDKIAIGVTLLGVPAITGDWADLDQRLMSEEGGEIFEVLARLCVHASEQAVIKIQKSVSRTELVLLMELGLQSERNEVPKILILDLDEGPLDPPAAPATFAEMGDLNYVELLKEEGPGKTLAPPVSGEFLVQQTGETLEAITLRGESVKEIISKTKVTGGPLGGDDNTKLVVRGAPNLSAGEEIRVISGGGPVDSGADTFRIKGGGSPLDAKPDLITVRDYQSKIEELERRVAGLPPSESTQSADKSESSGIFGLFKKVWPFKAQGASPTSTETDSDEDSEEGGETPESKGAVGAASEGKKKKTKKKKNLSDAADAIGSELDHESEGGESDSDAQLGSQKERSSKAKERNESEEESVAADKKNGDKEGEGESSKERDSELDKVVSETEVAGQEIDLKELGINADEMKRELASSPKGQKLVDSMMAQLVSERSKLSELTKKVTQAARVRELDFKTKEQSFIQSMKRKDDELKQRESAINHLKEQLSRSTSQFQTLKTQSSKQSQDDAGFKQKYTLTQKLLVTAKEENQELTKKIAALKDQVANQGVSKSRGGNSAEVLDLKGKLERTSRQVEEMKRNNASLQEQLNQAKKQASTGVGGGGEDLKRKLDASNRMVANARKETEQAQAKLAAMQKEELRLKGEVNRLNAELRNAKQAEKREGRGAPPAGGGLSGTPGATTEGPSSPKPAGSSMAARRRLGSGGGKGAGGGAAPPSAA